MPHPGSPGPEAPPDLALQDPASPELALPSQAATDIAALDAIIQLSLRAAAAAVQRLEDLTAKAAGWTDPRMLDPTLPVARMGRCIRQCIALKAKLPALYATGRTPPCTPAPHTPEPREARPRLPTASTDAERLLPAHEPFDDAETLDDPTDSPLTATALARYATAWMEPAHPPPPEPADTDAARERIRRTLEPEIDAHPDPDQADAIERTLSDRLEAEDFPTLLATLGPADLTQKLRRDLGLRPPGADPPCQA